MLEAREAHGGVLPNRPFARVRCPQRAVEFRHFPRDSPPQTNPEG